MCSQYISRWLIGWQMMPKYSTYSEMVQTLWLYESNTVLIPGKPSYTQRPTASTPNTIPVTGNTARSNASRNSIILRSISPGYWYAGVIGHRSEPSRSHWPARTAGSTSTTTCDTYPASNAIPSERRLYRLPISHTPTLITTTNSIEWPKLRPDGRIPNVHARGLSIRSGNCVPTASAITAGPSGATWCWSRTLSEYNK